MFSVKLNAHFVTNYGEDLFILGSSNEFGNWDVSKVVPLVWGKGDMWNVSLCVSPGTYEYKFIIKCGDAVRWEPGSNHKIEVTEGGLECYPQFGDAGLDNFQDIDKLDDPDNFEAGQKLEEIIEEDVDETGLPSIDIDIVISQVKCSRAKAVAALRQQKGDIVEAILQMS
eukprot:GHVR01160353.1.p1 GENE.GHVR01160353.1~~GHVR01160353.1.p1  ORF type:complete len:170 (+),score=38.64 GHVR01160353.1:289-798(+)